jgi:hypothetical protein
MGAVYKARQSGLDRLVALKILPPEVGKDASFAERFAREARALARLSHQHIVTVYDFGQAGGSYYLLMEFVEGANLRALIAGRHLEPREALGIVPQICEALQYAHDEGVVHRDIKPENILVDKKGRVKIADFGLAKLLDPGAAGARAVQRPPALTGSQQVMGTPHYMAPEQMERPLSVDHRADIYSLGVVFYEMLTGELPLGRFAPPSSKVRIDVRLDEVVLHALEKEPERRYQRASEVRIDVEHISHSPQSHSPAPQLSIGAAWEHDAVRARVTAPAIGLIVVGVLSLFPLFVLAAYVNASGSRLLTENLALLAIPAIIVVGAISMLRLRSYGWAIAAGVLALSPIPSGPCWLIGLPIGVWSLVILSRPEVKAAFGKHRALKRAKIDSAFDDHAAQVKPTSFPHVGLALAIICVVLAPFLLWWFASWGPPPVIRSQSAAPTAKGVPLAPTPPPLPTPSAGWIMGKDGPTLTDPFAQFGLRLKPWQIKEANKALQTIYQEYLAVEAQHTTRHTNDRGHLVVEIKPFPGPIENLEDRLWTKIDAIFDVDQQSIARLNLRLDPPDPERFIGSTPFLHPRDAGMPASDLGRPGFFGWGKRGVRIELWRVGSWYHWKFETPSVKTSSRAAQLPEVYRRFWREPGGSDSPPDGL